MKEYKRCIKLQRKASGRRPQSVSAEKDCLAVSLTAQGVSYFPYDLLSLCQWHFKYALAHLCQRPRLPNAKQKQGCFGKYKRTEQAQGGVTEINKIGQNDRHVSRLRVRKSGRRCYRQRDSRGCRGRLGRKLKHVPLEKGLMRRRKKFGDWGQKWLRGGD